MYHGRDKARISCNRGMLLIALSIGMVHSVYGWRAWKNHHHQSAGVAAAAAVREMCCRSIKQLLTPDIV